MGEALMRARFVLLAAMMFPLLGCGKNAIHFMREGGPVAQAGTPALPRVWGAAEAHDDRIQ